MAESKRRYAVMVPEAVGVKLEKVAEDRGISVSEALRGAISIYLAVGDAFVQDGGVIQDPECNPPAPEGDWKAPRNHIIKQLVPEGRYIEVYADRNRPGTWRWQTRYIKDGVKGSKSRGGYHDAELCAMERDDAARALSHKHEPMNFPNAGEVDCHTGAVRGEEVTV